MKQQKAKAELKTTEMVEVEKVENTRNIFDAATILAAGTWLLFLLIEKAGLKTNVKKDSHATKLRGDGALLLFMRSLNSDAAPTFPAGAFFVMLLFQWNAGPLTTKVKKQRVQNVNKSKDSYATRRPAVALFNFMREQFHKTFKQTFFGAKSGLAVRLKCILAFTLLLFTLPSVYSDDSGKAHLRLALSNPNAYCSMVACVAPIPQYFTLHGLWEQNFGPPVGSTSLTSFHIRDVSARYLLEYWPDLTKDRANNGIYNCLSFWDHEWRSHGAQICARIGCSRKRYFIYSLHLAATCIPNLETVFDTYGIVRDGQQLYDPSYIRNAIFRELRLYVVLICRNVKNNKLGLWEIHFCVNLRGQLENCTKWYKPGACYEGCYGKGGLQRIILPSAPLLISEEEL